MTTALTETNKAPKGTWRQQLRKVILRITLIIAILAPLVFVIAALGVKLGLWGLGFGLGTLTRDIGPKILMLSGALGLVSLILAGVFQPRKGFLTGLFAIIISAAGLVNLKGVKTKVAKLPFIHDVTTDTQDVPVFTAAIMEQRAKVKGVNTADYTGKRDARDKKLVSVLQTQAYPKIGPLILSEDLNVVFSKAEAIVTGLGWDVANSDLESGLIEATESTFWYGFEDDVIIRLRASEGGGTIVDMRSLSRIGGSDLGKNAARIEAFLEKLKAA